MTIIYQDGSTLECEHIEIAERHIYADDIYTIHIDDVAYIEG